MSTQLTLHSATERIVQLESRLINIELQLKIILAWQFDVATAATRQPPISPAYSPNLPATSVLCPPVIKSQRAEEADDLTSRELVTESTESIIPGNATNVQANEKEAVNEDVDSTIPKEKTALVSEIKTKIGGNQVHDEVATARLASDILDVMTKYSQHSTGDSNIDETWAGKHIFLERVMRQINCNEPVKMVLPSFPWKSINRKDKVDGKLPDLGEVLALSRLNAMCEEIKEVYHHGSELTIATDGLLFDDIVGIPDEDTWAYSEALVAIINEKRFASIKVARVPDLQGNSPFPVNYETYSSLASLCRSQILEQYGKTEDEIRDLIQSDNDSLRTYRGFIRFLEKDLKHSPIAKAATSGRDFRKCVKKVATAMMIRAESFTNFIQAKFPHHVRLSIHPSTGSTKLSVPLIATNDGSFPRTPWHCVIALGIDGSYSTVHSKDVSDTHTLIYHRGLPYYHREKSPLWDNWDLESVVFEPEYPNNLLVYPRDLSRKHILEDSQINSLRLLSEHYRGTILVSGFMNAAEVFSISDLHHAKCISTDNSSKMFEQDVKPDEDSEILELDLMSGVMGENVLHPPFPNTQKYLEPNSLQVAQPSPSDVGNQATGTSTPDEAPIISALAVKTEGGPDNVLLETTKLGEEILANAETHVELHAEVRAEARVVPDTEAANTIPMYSVKKPDMSFTALEAEDEPRADEARLVEVGMPKGNGLIDSEIWTCSQELLVTAKLACA